MAGPYQKIVAWPFTGYSGDLGPKRRRGDRQIPEGFYRLDGLNGASRYHLSLHVDYPNQADRFFAHRRHPGNNIFIHGNELTNGCIPIGDRAIEQLYLAVLDSRNAGYEVPAHLFPCRFDTPACARRLRADTRHNPKLAAFWANLEEGFQWFATTATLPVVTVDVAGRYGFAAPDSHHRRGPAVDTNPRGPPARRAEVHLPVGTTWGTLLRRYKRFLADVELPGGEVVTVHVPNPGAMRGCAAPGSPCLLSPAPGAHRKLAWTLEVVVDGGIPVGVNTSRANGLVAEALHSGVLAVPGLAARAAGADGGAFGRPFPGRLLP